VRYSYIQSVVELCRQRLTQPWAERFATAVQTLFRVRYLPAPHPEILARIV